MLGFLALYGLPFISFSPTKSNKLAESEKSQFTAILAVFEGVIARKSMHDSNCTKVNEKH